MKAIYPIGTSAAIALGVFVPLWAILNRFAKRRPCRPAVVPPAVERVLILGASSGIGRTLAHRYAERGAKICIVARRGAELDMVRSECGAISGALEDSVLSICADLTRAEDMIAIREKISESELCCLSDMGLDPISHSRASVTEWHGLDTLIVSAGVSALRPVLEIAGAEGPSVTQPGLDGVRRVEDVALAAVKGNYLGPLLSAVTMVCFRSY